MAAMVPRALRLPAVPAHSSAGRRVKIANCVTLSALAYSGVALCWAPAVALGLWCKTVTKSDPGKPDKIKPLGGGVKHDARGNAVWQWLKNTSRIAIESTSRLLRKLEAPELKVEGRKDEELRIESDRDAGGGYDPYNQSGSRERGKR